MTIMLDWMQCGHESPLLIRRSLMVTLAGLEPATSPAPGEQGRSIPLELQRRRDLHDRLWGTPKWADVHVRFGSIADIGSGSRHVRFTPKSGHC